MVRRVLAASIALAGLLATASADAAPNQRLDGRARRAYQYAGTLTSPQVPTTFSTMEPFLAPHPNDCTKESCDLRKLELVLPKGTTWGKFRATVVVPAELNIALVLYDSENRSVEIDELWRPDEHSQTCCDNTDYRMEVSSGFLRAGRYTLGIVDRAGAGRFDASVEWIAHPPDRPTSS